MRSAGTIAVVVLMAVISCAGQTRPAPKAAPARPPTPAARRGAPSPPAPALSDAQIEAAIRAKLAKSKISVDKFQVHVQGGVATVEGRTDVIQHKGVATRLAKSGGAVAVNNRVQISDAARDKAAANLEKGRRRAQIKRGDARSDSPEPRKTR